MLVIELIEKLKEMPDQAEVMVITPDENWKYLKIIDCEAEFTNLVSLGTSYNDEEDTSVTQTEDVKSKKEWDSYLEYLKEWADRSSGIEFYGNSPVGFDEFLDNEYVSNNRE